MPDRNLAASLRRQAETIGPRPAIRFKRDGRYQVLTWAQYRDDALACAAALAAHGVEPGDRVGLLAENRVEWLVADVGILTAGAVAVTPHASLSAKQVAFQMRDAGAKWLFVSTAAQLEKVNHASAEMPDVKGVVVFDAAAGGAASWDEFLARGRAELPGRAAELARREAATGPDDMATVMYTSGTTGEPKGVMLTHGNILSNVLACLEGEPVFADDVNLCWLPLSHIYARTIDHYERLVAGAELALAESAETVVANLAEVRPTQFSSVPRFYEKLLAAVASPDPAVTAAKLRAVFGPRARCLGAGGAPLPAAVERALRDAGLPVFPGYGLTETSPVLTFNLSTRDRPFTVGAAVPGVEIRIAADGEVLARGPCVMKGYWNNPAATADAIRDGWFHTGDLGALDADGFLTITGRKKELLVLSNGKKVVPTQIEGLLVADDCIDQAAVYGEGRNYLTALVVPHWENVRRALGGRDEGEDALAADPAVRDLLRARIDARLADVAGYEQVRKFAVLPRPFTVAAEELTVSLKMRREVIFVHHRAALEALYAE